MTVLKERVMMNRDTYGFAEVVDVSATDHQFAGGGKIASGLLIGTGGNVELLMGSEESDANSVIISTLSAGVIYKLFFNKIKAAGTTALGIVALD